SLVNLIADREVVPELVANLFSEENVERELENILYGSERQQMMEGYEEVARRLGDGIAPNETARLIVERLH
ncbi:MAG: lipid-A-disaccharide synthase, partial [Prevotella sp.]|nr:lipid-A-disaccharide synthase [Prevotella sp.]